MTLRGFILYFFLTHPALATASGLQLSGTENQVPLVNYLESYEDKSAALNIEAITQTEFSTSVAPHLLHPGYSKSAFWFKLNISNTTAAPFTRWLSVQPSRLQDVSLYVRKNGEWHRLDAGSHIPFAQHPIPATGALFPLQLAEGESASVYLRVASSTAIIIDPTLWEPLAFRETNLHTSMFDGILLGGMALTALFGLLMFVTLKDRAFLLHALTTLTYCIYEINFKGYGLMYLWPDATDWATRSIGLFGSLSIGGLMLFVRELLATRTRLPRWDRLLLALLATLPVLALFTLFGDYRATMSIGSLIGTTLLFAIVVTTLLSIRQHFLIMRFYIAAFGIMMLGNVARILSLYGFIGTSPLIEYATPLASLSANIFMLAAVVDRIMQARKEKETAQLALLSARAEHEAKLELAVAQRTADLNVALTEARTANQTKSRLLAYISHDLRSPLATIINYVHRLNRQASGEALQYQATIEHCAAHQLELIDDLVEYARGELDHLQLAPAPTYLHAWLDSIAQQAELLAGQYGNRFALVLDNALPPVVVFDPKRLRQVLLNLLGNAAKFTSNGDIRLRIQADTMPDDSVSLTFAVEDSGPGIPQNDVERIFLPFERRKSERQGFGLGLSIAQQIVKGMGDELKVDSTPEQGCTFSFRLVLKTAAESDIQQPAQAFAVMEFFGTGRTILVADDNESSRDYLKEVLSAVNFDVVSAENGEQAWQLASEQHFDVILADQFMPRMGGWELLHKLRGQSVTTPVVLCSSMPPQRPDGFPKNVDFSTTLLKPVSAEKLLHLMQDLLNKTSEPFSEPSAPATPIPDELLLPLRNLIDIGGITEIEEWAENFAVAHLDHAAFAHAVYQAARQLDFNTLATLAGGSLNQSA
jgi:signal transduction histidine kinase/DNA-binding response OmpR family regulator